MDRDAFTTISYMFKFIHAADIHLDSAQTGLAAYEGAPVEACRGATRKAFQNVVQLAIDERAAFVVIAGDLYDGDWTDYNTGLFLVGQAARLRDHGIKIYIIRGNHDAANQMTKDLRLPDNARMLWSDRPETVFNDELNVAVHGQGFATRKVVDNLARGYPARKAGYFNLGILHTCLSGREGHERYAPCTIDDLRSRDYDYWALGHVHVHEVLSEGEPWIVFSGNTQGRHARETGPKGCVVATVGDDGRMTDATFRIVDAARWESCVIDVSGVGDVDDVLQMVESRLRTLSAECDRGSLLTRLTLRGPCRAHGGLVSRSTEVLNQIRGVALEASSGRTWIEKVVIQTAPAADPAVDDAALGEIEALLSELSLDEARRGNLFSSALGDFKRKHAIELNGLLDDSECETALLNQVGPLLRARLEQGSRPVADESGAASIADS